MVFNGVKQKIHQFFDDIPRWEKYKQFFQILIFKYLALWFSLVPIVLTFFEGLTRPLSITISGKTYGLELSLPFTWELLWLASLIYLFALILYAIFCPSFIIQYNQYSDYLKYSHDQRWLTWESFFLLNKFKLEKKEINKFVDRLKTKKYIQIIKTDISGFSEPQVEEKQTKYYFEHDGEKYYLGMPLYNSSGEPDLLAEKGLFWEIFGRYSASRLTIRKTILYLVVTSAVIFSFVLLQHIYTGITYFIIWLKSFLLSTFDFFMSFL